MKLFEKNMKLDVEHGNAGFVIPFWSKEMNERIDYLNDAVDSIMKQSDQKFHIYIVDDDSPSEEVKDYLRELEKHNEKITVIFANDNKGPGRCRNLGIKAAYKDNCPFICFLDSDDMAHKDRVAVARKKFLEEEEVDIVYSHFDVVDEKNQPVEFSKLIEGIKIILTDMETRPLYGYDVWKSIVVERDNLTIPSALNVRTELAIEIPFPEQYRFHEDTYTWLRYSGYGAYVYYENSIPSLYRVPQNKAGSESRDRAGGIEEFNRMRCRIIIEGLSDAMDFAMKRGQVKEDEKMDYKIKFLLNVASMIAKEGTMNVVNELVEMASQLDKDKFETIRGAYSL